ncbi:MAG: thioredoxin [Salinirussus sp.]
MSEREEIRRKKAEKLRRRLASEDADSGDAGSGPDEPVHVTGRDHLEGLLDGDGVVLIDFHAEWCGPCKMLEPVVSEIAAETPATVAKVDIDDHQKLAQQYRVQGVPTLYLFADGEQVERIVGVKGKSEIVSLIEQYT